MSFVEDIVATWRRPRALFKRRFAEGQREERVIMILMVGAILSFVAQIPEITRMVHLEDRDLDTDLAAAAMGTLMILPLVFYGLAAVITLLAQAVGRPIGFYAGRFVLFWTYLAASPLMLLYGLGTGFSPESLGLIVVGLAWLTSIAVFMRAGIKEAGLWWQRGEQNAAE